MRNRHTFVLGSTNSTAPWHIASLDAVVAIFLPGFLICFA
jgi:hypothetical protein